MLYYTSSMKKTGILFTLLAILITQLAFSQKKEEKLYDDYFEKMSKKDFPEALKVLEKFIEKFPDSKNLPNIYFKKAQLNSELNNNEAALQDFTMAHKKDSTFSEAIRQRGNLYFKMDKLDKAMDDYNLALKINPEYAEAYANRGFIYKKQDKNTEACENFEKALKYGYTDIFKYMKVICDSGSAVIQTYLLRTLTEKTTDSEYGYSEKKPIKIGMPVQRQKMYFSLLRDSNGNSVKFKRIASCCPYASKGSVLGMAMCDKYEVELDGEIKILYISFYDYEEPKIPLGFKSVKEGKK